MAILRQIPLLEHSKSTEKQESGGSDIYLFVFIYFFVFVHKKVVHMSLPLAEPARLPSWAPENRKSFKLTRFWSKMESKWSQDED